MKKITIILIILIIAYLGFNYLNNYQNAFFNNYENTSNSIDKVEDTLDNINSNSKYGESKYYIAENELRYQAYNLLEQDITKVVTAVNSNLDYDYYELIINTNTKDNELILVNKYYKLNDKFIPEDLKIINNDIYATKNTVEAYNKMLSAANKEELNFYVASGYRSYNYQNNLYQNYVSSNGQTWADNYSARPGHSEHQTGLAIDILTSNSNFNTFGNTKEYEWLVNNCYKYGFILRYTEDNSYITGYNAESWHYRYVGVEAATYIYENNITLEEYYAFYIKGDN